VTFSVLASREDAGHRIERTRRLRQSSRSICWSVDGQDLRSQPLVERKEARRRLLKTRERIRYLQHVNEHGEALYRHFEELGLEGVVGKKADAPYSAGRSNVWKKVKTPAFRAIEAKRLEHKGR
jgi:hypothetical protein